MQQPRSSYIFCLHDNVRCRHCLAQICETDPFAQTVRVDSVVWHSLDFVKESGAKNFVANTYYRLPQGQMGGGGGVWGAPAKTTYKFQWTLGWIAGFSTPFCPENPDLT